MHNHGVTFELTSARMLDVSKSMTYFSNNKAIWIATTDYCMHFFLVVLFPLIAILQLINRSINKFYIFITCKFQINDVILLLKCLVFIL